MYVNNGLKAEKNDCTGNDVQFYMEKLLNFQNPVQSDPTGLSDPTIDPVS